MRSHAHRKGSAVFLSLFKSRGKVQPGPTTAPAEGRDGLLAAAEVAFAAANEATNPFARDAQLDRVTELMAKGFGATLWRFCAAQRGVDETTAEDLAQQALLTFREALPRFEGRSSLKTFLYGIAANLARSRAVTEQRRERILAQHQESVAAILHPPGGEAEREAHETQERLAALEAALETLSPREAFLVRARLVDRQDYATILPRFQALFGDSVTTAEGLRTLYFHAKNHLGRLLRETP